MSDLKYSSTRLTDKRALKRWNRIAGVAQIVDLRVLVGRIDLRRRLLLERHHSELLVPYSDGLGLVSCPAGALNSDARSGASPNDRNHGRRPRQRDVGGVDDGVSGGDVRAERSLLLEHAAAVRSTSTPLLFGQRDVGPAGELVGFIPLLSVTETVLIAQVCRPAFYQTSRFRRSTPHFCNNFRFVALSLQRFIHATRTVRDASERRERAAASASYDIFLYFSD